MSKRIGVLLSGCGHQDGSEIHESVITLLALDRAGAEVRIMAPHKSQMHTINHLTGKPTGEIRNVLNEGKTPVTGSDHALHQVPERFYLPVGSVLCSF